MLLLLPVLLFSVVVHEVAHAWVARREGDDTAERLGRITLNPIPHLDLVGSILVPALLHFTGASFLFGWAKPVPVNPNNFREPVWSDIRVSLAGIVSNLILAVICALILAATFRLEAATGLGALGYVAAAADYGIIINIVLAVFNLVPIPPLDGSHVVYHLLPPSLREGYRKVGGYGLLILMALFIMAPGQIWALITPPIEFLYGLASALVGVLA